MANKIKRTIEYHWLQWEDHAGNYNNGDHNLLCKAMEKICNAEVFDEVVLAVEKHEKTKAKERNWFFGAVAKTKLTDYPLKQDLTDYTTEGLDLKDNEGLYLPSHFGVYNGQILICEYNFDGLVVKSFLERKINKYLEKHPNEDIKSLCFQPIIRDDVQELIENNDKIRGISLTVATNRANIFKRQNNSIASAFNSCEHPDNMDIEVYYKLGNRRAKYAYESMGNLKNEAFEIMNDNQIMSNLKNFYFIVKNDNGDNEKVNALKQVFKTSEEVLKIDSKTKAVDTDDVFFKFKDTYDDNKEELIQFIESMRE